MSEAASQLIKAFSALPSSERHAVILELAKISEADTPISDDDLVRAGDQLFRIYDEEEAALDDSKEG